MSRREWFLALQQAKHDEGKQRIQCAHHRGPLAGVSDLEKLQSLLQNDLDRMFNEISLVSDREIIFVSDELGMGIVPANAMGRVYRDLVGLANQYIAKKADEVYLSIAGITVELKSRGLELS